MPDYNIPASTFAQIPMAAGNLARPQTVQPFTPVDVPAAQTRAYAMEAAKGQAQAQVQSQQEEQRDKMIVEQYKQSGGAGDFVTPEGIEQSLKDLKGQISDKGYNNLANLLGQKKAADYKMQAELAKADEAQLAKMTDDMEFANRTFNAPMVKAYKDTLEKTGDQQKATEAFNTAKAAAIEMASGIKDAAGKPKYPPNIIEKMKKATPEEVEHIYELSDFYAKRTKDEQTRRLEEGKILGEEAKAKKYTAEAKAVEAGGKEAAAIIAIDKEVEDGTLSPEEGEKRKATIRAGMKKGGAAQLEPSMSKDTLQRIAQAYIRSGDKSAIPANLGRGVQGSANLAALEDAITAEMQKQNLSSDEIVKRKLEFQGATAGMKSLGQRQAKLDSAAYELEGFADNALASYAKVKRGNIIPVNDIMRRVEMGTGSPEEAEFATMIQSLIGAYASVIGRGQPTVHSMQEAEKIINKNLAPKQFEAMINSLKKEKEKVVESSEKAAEGITRKMTKSASPSEMRVSPEEQRTKDDARLRILNDEKASIQADLAKSPNDPRLIQELKDIDTEINTMSKKSTSGRPSPAFPSDIQNILKKYGKKPTAKLDTVQDVETAFKSGSISEDEAHQALIALGYPAGEEAA